MILLNENDIKKVFSMNDAVKANKQAFLFATNENVEMPLRTKILAPKVDGCFLFMPAYSEELESAGIKIVNVFPENIEKNLPVVPAEVILIDGETGIINSILDGTYITRLRTGAASGVAFDILGKIDSKIGAIIGTGGQAKCQIEAMLNVRNLDEVRIYSLHYDNAVKLANEMNEDFASFNTNFIPCKTSDEAIENADLIVTVTTSNKPVFDANKVKKGATISAIGSYQPNMQELDPLILQKASKIYFDLEEAVLSEAGDILKPLDLGQIKKTDFTGNIGDIIKGSLKGRENDDEIIVFKSVGIAIQDLVTAKAIYDKAVNENIGLIWKK